MISTNRHATALTDLETGDTVVVISNDAVELCGILVAKRIGAERAVAIDRHEGHLEAARKLNAANTVLSRDQKVVKEVLELTHGSTSHVLKYVGAASALEAATRIAHPDGSIGAVDVSHVESADFLQPIFYKNLSSSTSGTPIQNYIKGPMDDVL